MLFVKSQMHPFTLQSQTSSSSLQEEMAGSGALDKQLAATRQGSKRRLRPTSYVVRFDGVTTVWSSPPLQASNEQETTTEIASLWYTKEEYAQFRTTLVAEAKEALRSDKTKESKSQSGVSSIRRAYEMIASTTCFATQDAIDSNSSSDDDNVNFAIESILPDLDLPCRGCSDFVGLEQLVAKKIHREKHRRRCMLWDAVLDIQQAIHEQHGPKACKDLQSNIIRRVCEEISGPSKLFALYLGMASSAHETTLFVSI
ncbi:hypothetical protein ACA910_020870 [Epithemia clementina (nom. ined.)]